MPNAVRVHPNPPLPQMTKRTTALTVRLLESGAGTLTTELLGLAPTGIGDEEAAVELDEGALQDVLGVLVDVLGVVGDLKGDKSQSKSCCGCGARVSLVGSMLRDGTYNSLGNLFSHC